MEFLSHIYPYFNEICEKLHLDIINSKHTENFGLLSGDAGKYLLLFLYRKELNLPYSDIEAGFYDFIRRVVNVKTYNFTDGLSGIGWLLEFLCSQSILERKNIEPLLRQIDDLAYTTARQCLKNENNDFLYGPVGESVYLLSRHSQNTKVKHYLVKIIEDLYNRSIKTEMGCYWPALCV